MGDIVYKAKRLLKVTWRGLVLLYLMAMMGICEYACWTYGSSWAATMENVYAWAFIVITALFLIEAIVTNRKRKSSF